MKKFGFLFAVAMFLLGFGITMSGCQTDLKSDVANNISDIRYNIFVGQTCGVSVNLMCGMRENPYNYDGISYKKTEFGVISVDLSTIPTQDQIYYSLTFGKKTVSGVLEENPYNHLFMTDIEKIVDDDGVFLTIENVVENMQLLPISKDWNIQYQDAFEIGVKTLQEDLQQLYSNNKFCGECYLKIVMDKNEINNPYYWCFMFVGQNNRFTKTIIFDVNSGEVLTQTTT